MVHRTVLHPLLPHADPQGRRADGELLIARRSCSRRRSSSSSARCRTGSAARRSLSGLLLAAITYFPIFHAITHYANPALADAQERASVTVIADPDYDRSRSSGRHVQVPSPCDVAKAALVRRGVPYSNEHVNVTAGPRTPSPGEASIRVGSTVIPSYDATLPGAADAGKAFDSALGGALTTARYPASAAPERINKPMLTFLLWILVIYVTMVYGPIAAMLVDFSDEDPVHVDVAPLSHRQRLVRRLPPTDRLRDRRRHGEHLLGTLVPDRRRGDHAGDRCAVRPRDEGRGHHE